MAKCLNCDCNLNDDGSCPVCDMEEDEDWNIPAQVLTADDCTFCGKKDTLCHDCAGCGELVCINCGVFREQERPDSLIICRPCWDTIHKGKA